MASGCRKLADLRVVDLRLELEKRSMEKGGNKQALVDRMYKAMVNEGLDPKTHIFGIDKKMTKRSSTIATLPGSVSKHKDDEEGTKNVNKEERVLKEPETIDDNAITTTLTKNIDTAAFDVTGLSEYSDIEKEDAHDQERVSEASCATPSEVDLDVESILNYNISDTIKTSGVCKTVKPIENTDEEAKEGNGQTDLARDTASNSVMCNTVKPIENTDEKAKEGNGHIEDSARDNADEKAKKENGQKEDLARNTADNSVMINLDDENTLNDEKILDDTKTSDERDVLSNKDEHKILDTGNTLDDSISLNSSSTLGGCGKSVDDNEVLAYKKISEPSEVVEKNAQMKLCTGEDVEMSAEKMEAFASEEVPVKILKIEEPQTKEVVKINASSKSHSTNIQKSSRNKNLWITNISQNTRAVELRQMMAAHGRVIGAKVVINAKHPGASCFGYVTMETVQDAENCIAKLNNSELNGQIICVEKVSLNHIMAAKQTPIGKPSQCASTESSNTAEKSSENKSDQKDINQIQYEKDKTKTNYRDLSKATVDPNKMSEHSNRRSRSQTNGKRKMYNSQNETRGDGRILTFNKIKEERERQRLREKERQLREENRRRLKEETRQCEVDRLQRLEATRLEREKAELQLEREQLEKDKAEIIMLEREKHKLKHENLEIEKIELKRVKSRFNDLNHHSEKMFHEPYTRESSYESQKRPRKYDKEPPWYASSSKNKTSAWYSEQQTLTHYRHSNYHPSIAEQMFPQDRPFVKERLLLDPTKTSTNVRSGSIKPWKPNPYRWSSTNTALSGYSNTSQSGSPNYVYSGVTKRAHFRPRNPVHFGTPSTERSRPSVGFSVNNGIPVMGTFTVPPPTINNFATGKFDFNSWLNNREF